MVSFINLYPIPVLFGSTCDLRDLLLTLAEPPIHTDFFQASPMSERHIPIKCLRKRPIQIALEKKKKKKKLQTKSREEFKTCWFFLVQSHFLKRLSNKLCNAKKSFSEHHQVWDPPPYAECFEVREHKDAPAKQLFALVFMCGDPSPLPWMTTMAGWSPMARPCKTLSVLKLHWKRSNLPIKMKIIVIMALIVIIYHNHNVCLSNDDFWRHSNDAGNDFWVQQNKKLKKKKTAIKLAQCQVCNVCLAIEGSAKPRTPRHHIHIFDSRKQDNTGEIFPEEQTNQGIKGLSKFRANIIFLGPQDHLQWSEKSSVSQLPTRHR